MVYSLLLLYNDDGGVAQWLEQRTHNPLVDGSSPSTPTTFEFLASSEAIFVTHACNDVKAET